MQLVIRIVDSGPEPAHSKAGHVVVAVPDSHVFSATERANPDWVIVQSDLTEVECQALMEAAPGVYRKHRLDVRGLAAGPVPRDQLTARVI